jgi:hypothetical protein
MQDASVGIQSKLHELKERYPKLDAQAMQLRRRLVKISAAMKEPK